MSLYNQVRLLILAGLVLSFGCGLMLGAFIALNYFK
jgi:uncharacterized protein YneF (UPF0154 family)